MTSPRKPLPKLPLDGETLTIDKIVCVPKGNGSRTEYVAHTMFEGKPSLKVTMYEEHIVLFAKAGHPAMAYRANEVYRPVFCDVVVGDVNGSYRITGVYRKDGNGVKTLDKPEPKVLQPTDMVKRWMYDSLQNRYNDLEKRHEAVSANVRNLQDENMTLREQVETLTHKLTRSLHDSTHAGYLT